MGLWVPPAWGAGVWSLWGRRQGRGGVFRVRRSCVVTSIFSAREQARRLLRGGGWGEGLQKGSTSGQGVLGGRQGGPRGRDWEARRERELLRGEWREARQQDQAEMERVSQRAFHHLLGTFIMRGWNSVPV